MTPEAFWGSQVCHIIKFLWAFVIIQQAKKNEFQFTSDLIRWAGWNSYAFATRWKKQSIKKPEQIYPFIWDDEKRSKKPSIDDIDWDTLKGMQDKSKR